MTKLKLVLEPNKCNPVFSIDGKIVNFRPTERGAQEAVIESENDVVDLSIETLPCELIEPNAGKHYLAFFFASIFSFFNPPYPKRDIFEVRYSGKIKISECNHLVLTFNKPKKNQKAIKPLGGNAPHLFEDNPSNVYILNKKAQKRRNLSNLLQTFVRLAVVAVIIVFVVLALIK